MRLLGTRFPAAHVIGATPSASAKKDWRQFISTRVNRTFVAKSIR
jgi:hypothetical protein